MTSFSPRLLITSLVMIALTALLLAHRSCSCHQVPPPEVVIAPSHFLNDLFDPGKNFNASLHPLYAQWTGGDCDVSTAIDSRYSLFVFGDTLIGSYKTFTNNGSRARVSDPFPPGKGKMPHASVGVFDKQSKHMNYYWGNDYTSFLRMPGQDHETYFWPSVITPPLLTLDDNNNDGGGGGGGDAYYDSAAKTICIVGEQVQRTGGGGGGGGGNGDWDFITNGTWVVCLDGVAENIYAPEKWKQRWSRVPHTGNSSAWSFAYSIEWREAILFEPSGSNGTGGQHYHHHHRRHHHEGRGEEKEDYLYMLGNYMLTGHDSSHQILSRIPRKAFVIFNWSAQEFWTKINGRSSYIRDAWNLKQHPGFAVADLLPLWSGWFTNIPEFTVEWSPKLQKYFVLFIPPFNLTIQMRTADRLEGPWSGDKSSYPHTVYHLPPYPQPEVFCYALKFHSALDDVIMKTMLDGNEEKKNHRGVVGGVATGDSRKRVFSYVCNTQHINALYQPGWSNFYIPRFMTLELM